MARRNSRRRRFGRGNRRGALLIQQRSFALASAEAPSTLHAVPGRAISDIVTGTTSPGTTDFNITANWLKLTSVTVPANVARVDLYCVGSTNANPITETFLCPEERPTKIRFNENHIGGNRAELADFTQAPSTTTSQPIAVFLDAAGAAMSTANVIIRGIGLNVSSS